MRCALLVYRRKSRRQQEKPEEVRVVPGLQFSTSLARYIDGSVESSRLIISMVTHEEFRWMCSTHTESRCIWPRE